MDMTSFIKKGLCLFFFFIALGLSAQVEISGTVIDDYNNKPIDGAKIKVKGVNAGAYTDQDGKFTILFNAEFPVVLVSAYLGFNDLETEVLSEVDTLLFRMKTNKTLDLQMVNVRSFASDKEKESALSIETMSLNDIKETPSTDFYEGLSHMKGVDLTSASLGFKVVNTRGFNSTSPVRTLQIIDGVDNASPGLNFALGNFLGASELDLMKVEVISGASSAFYGPNAFNGVISMYTKNPFKFQGFSASVKGGERLLNEYAFRYAKAFQNKNGEDKFAFKLNFSYLSANDWEANNSNSVEGVDTDQNNPGGYDAVNRYGDENLSPNINNALDNQAIWQTPGLGRWHRTGYWEKDIVDYDTKNLKASAAFHYLINPDLELIMASNFGTGTTVYQGDNRFSLKDILFFQNRLELRKKDDFFIRAYATNEDAGNSYDAVLTAYLLQDAAADDWDWSERYRQYWSANIVDRVQELEDDVVWEPQIGVPFDLDAIQNVVSSNPDSMYVWHQEAANYANGAYENWSMSDFYEPGTERFDSLLNDITSKTSFLEGGSRIQDQSALYHLHGEKIFNSEFAKFTIGANGRIYNPRSGGSLFSDTNGVRILNKEFGVYGGIEKRFDDDKWIAKATIRVDKNQNFKFLPSPAVSLIWQPNKKHTLRGTFSAAIRNPTLLNQYMYYNVGRARLVGNINGYDSLVTIESLRDFLYTENANALEYFSLDPIEPEKVKCMELGYRAVLLESVYLDMNYYFNFYTNFIGFINGADIFVQPLGGAYINDVYRVATNSRETITTQGFSIGLNYYLGDHYALNGNYSWNVLNKQSDDPIIPAYNTPENKFNLGFRGRDLSIKKLTGLGFSVNYKWIQGFVYEGSPQFTGSIPTYSLLDVQVNKFFEKANLTLKIGASNVLNNQVLQVYGGPYVGRMVYTSLSFDFKDK
jgi:outer membrane receptor for ferrienterochelin and colicin